jgi:hypothetical protein
VNDERKPMTRMLAVCRNNKHDFICVMENHGRDENWMLDDYVRLSEWQTVEFKELPPEAMAEAEMKSLSELRAQTVAEFTEKLNYIDGRLANLRALTGPVSS